MTTTSSSSSSSSAISKSEHSINRLLFMDIEKGHSGDRRRQKRQFSGEHWPSQNKDEKDRWTSLYFQLPSFYLYSYQIQLIEYLFPYKMSKIIANQLKIAQNFSDPSNLKSRKFFLLTRRVMVTTAGLQQRSPPPRSSNRNCSCQLLWDNSSNIKVGSGPEQNRIFWVLIPIRPILIRIS